MFPFPFIVSNISVSYSILKLFYMPSPDLILSIVCWATFIRLSTFLFHFDTSDTIKLADIKCSILDEASLKIGAKRSLEYIIWPHLPMQSTNCIKFRPALMSSVVVNSFASHLWQVSHARSLSSNESFSLSFPLLSGSSYTTKHKHIATQHIYNYINMAKWREIYDNTYIHTYIKMKHTILHNGKIK